MKQSRISGYDQGSLLWQIESDNVWSTRSRYVFYADRILSGFVLDSEGKLLIAGINAREISINTRSNTISVTGYCEADLLPRISKEKSSKVVIAEEPEKNKISIKSDELRYFSDSKKTYLSKNVELQKDDFIIKPTKGVDIDNEKNIAEIYDGFHMYSDSFKVTGNSMVIYIDDDKSDLGGPLIFEKIASKNVSDDLDEQEKELIQYTTRLSCDNAIYQELDGAHILEVDGNILIEQKGKLISGDTGIYNQSNDSFKLNKNVAVELENLDWLYDDNLKKKLKNEDIKQSLNQQTYIKSNKLVYDGELKKTVLLGDVIIKQSDKTISADKVSLFDDSSEILCEGKVKVVKKDEDTLYCSMLKINIKDELFFAQKGVYSEFRLKND